MIEDILTSISMKEASLKKAELEEESRRSKDSNFIRKCCVLIDKTTNILKDVWYGNKRIIKTENFKVVMTYDMLSTYTSIKYNKKKVLEFSSVTFSPYDYLSWEISPEFNIYKLEELLITCQAIIEKNIETKTIESEKNLSLLELY